jgi:hypothetical protein
MYLLIPNEVTASDAVVWVAAINENVNPVTLSLAANGSLFPLAPNWSVHTTQSGLNNVIFQYVRIQGLSPNTEYLFELLAGNLMLRHCRVRTLPMRLPTLDGRPFTLLLGSCFSQSNKESGSLGGTYLNLLRQQDVDVKILCGDQVYLDDPALHYTWHRHSSADLEDRLFGSYVKTWGQEDFRKFLEQRANFFSSDDHEFWNNAPNRAPLVLDSWTQNGRNTWWNIATSLYRLFQGGKSVNTFNVGSLSFFVGDTRMNRDPNRQNFMSVADLGALDTWITNLQGVGVIVLGQPLFSSKAGLLGNLTDWNLPDYDQYRDLVRIIHNTSHSLIVLTGDVHYGRISHCLLKQDVFLYEIISSPSMLVNPLVGRKWHAAPDLFPAFGIPGVAQKQVVNDLSYKFIENHFLTLSFFQDGGRTRVRVTSVEVRPGGAPPTPVQRADLFLS